MEKSALPAVLLGMFATACLEVPPLAERAAALQECPEEYCGSNSPRIEVYGFHELNLVGHPNPQNMVLTRATLAGEPVHLTVYNSELKAQLGEVVITGADLVGLLITVTIDGRDFALELMSVGQMSYPVPSTSGDTLPTYVFEYIDSLGVRRNLCGNRPIQVPTKDLLYWEAFGQVPREAILFEGDRIDTSTMTISPSFDPTWFNIGCAGHTLSKLHLTRNTVASRASVYGHGLADRQATLKLLAADYCGTGKPFTVAGQPLAWRDPQQVMQFYSGASALEARWGASGAICLSRPRLSTPANAAGAQLFPNIWQAIAAECPDLLNRPCTNSNIYQFEGADRVSANR